MEAFTLDAPDGAKPIAYRSLPTGQIKAVVQLAHGMAEHVPRYRRLAGALNAAGYAVYGGDHRGHGASAGVHGLGDFGEAGFQAVVDDMAALSAVAKAEHPGKPLVLLGHSMGSFASQIYLLQYADNLDALVLSGTSAMDALLAHIMGSGSSGSLESFNAAFEPSRTPFDWLSRDPAEVDAYIADPLCGFALAERSTQSMFGLGVGARTDPRLGAVRKDLPICIISGEVDPVVGPDQAFVNVLIETYRGLGLGDITHRVYPAGRHEMFNETNRDEVTAELVAWLGEKV